MLNWLKKLFKKKEPEPKPKTLKEESSCTMSDPSALPTGDGSEMVRIKKAQKENRWMSVGREYAEEWQNVVLLSMNGLKTMKTMADKFKSEEEIGMWVSSLDTQVRRMEAVAGHLANFTWAIDGKPANPEFIAALDKCAKEMTAVNMNPNKDNVKAVFGTNLDAMKAAMELAGFAFKMEAKPLVGEKFAFEKELLYVGTPIAKAEMKAVA